MIEKKKNVDGRRLTIEETIKGTEIEALDQEA